MKITFKLKYCGILNRIIRREDWLDISFVRGIYQFLYLIITYVFVDRLCIILRSPNSDILFSLICRRIPWEPTLWTGIYYNKIWKWFALKCFYHQSFMFVIAYISVMNKLYVQWRNEIIMLSDGKNFKSKIWLRKHIPILNFYDIWILWNEMLKIFGLRMYFYFFHLR